MTEKLYRWVRCAERLPAAPAENQWPDYVVRDSFGKVANLAYYGNGFCIGKATGSGMVGGVVDNVKEWLEELPPQDEPSEDEVERVKLAIVAAMDGPCGSVVTAYDWDNIAKAAIAAMTSRPKAEVEGVDIEAAISRIEELQDAGCGAFTTRSISEICAAAWGKKAKEKDGVDIEAGARVMWNYKDGPDGGYAEPHVDWDVSRDTRRKAAMIGRTEACAAAWGLKAKEKADV